MGSKYKEALMAGLVALAIPIAKMLIESILDRLSNKKYISSTSECNDRDYYANRYKAGVYDKNRYFFVNYCCQ